jgi:exodeoxyribonuclease-3
MPITIMSWNVNGYRAALNKGFREWLTEVDPDVICLQEIKVQLHQLKDDQKTYSRHPQTHWHPAQKPGYSGVATFSRIPVLDCVDSLNREEFDSEGRLLITRYPRFTLFNVYFPNGQRGQDRVDYKLAFYSRLLEVIGEYRQRGDEVVITGDYNTAHREMDLARPKENTKTSGFLPEERAMVEQYLQTGLVDVFRNKYPDKVQYTYWDQVSGARARNVGWRIDYFLISPGLLPHVTDARILDQVPGSDHCPIALDLD